MRSNEVEAARGLHGVRRAVVTCISSISYLAIMVWCLNMCGVKETIESPKITCANGKASYLDQHLTPVASWRQQGSGTDRWPQ